MTECKDITSPKQAPRPTGKEMEDITLTGNRSDGNPIFLQWRGDRQSASYRVFA